MQVYGVDFTSRPTKSKPITCARCDLDKESLRVNDVVGLYSLHEFDDWLNHDGNWIAGMDFPFGQSQRFIDNIGWPPVWSDYVRLVSTMSRQQFRQTLDDYRAPRPSGDKEHQRLDDRATGAISPQKLYGVPVGLMFFEGAQRLLASGVHIPGVVQGDKARQVVEAYPGVLARRVTKDGYKSDTKAKQTLLHQRSREHISQYVQSAKCKSDYGVSVACSVDLAEDPSGDTLDAVLCAVQASWAWIHSEKISKSLHPTHKLEGWIADPLALGLQTSIATDS